jgi:hypothetical protein
MLKKATPKQEFGKLQRDARNDNKLLATHRVLVLEHNEYLKTNENNNVQLHSGFQVSFSDSAMQPYVCTFIAEIVAMLDPRKHEHETNPSYCVVEILDQAIKCMTEWDNAVSTATADSGKNVLIIALNAWFTRAQVQFEKERYSAFDALPYTHEQMMSLEPTAVKHVASLVAKRKEKKICTDLQITMQNHFNNKTTADDVVTEKFNERLKTNGVYTVDKVANKIDISNFYMEMHKVLTDGKTKYKQETLDSLKTTLVSTVKILDKQHARLADMFAYMNLQQQSEDRQENANAMVHVTTAMELMARYQKTVITAVGTYPECGKLHTSFIDTINMQNVVCSVMKIACITHGGVLTDEELLTLKRNTGFLIKTVITLCKGRGNGENIDFGTVRNAAVQVVTCAGCSLPNFDFPIVPLPPDDTSTSSSTGKIPFEPPRFNLVKLKIVRNERMKLSDVVQAEVGHAEVGNAEVVKAEETPVAGGEQKLLQDKGGRNQWPRPASGRTTIFGGPGTGGKSSNVPLKAIHNPQNIEGTLPQLHHLGHTTI